jgi:hypothetical protein
LGECDFVLSVARLLRAVREFAGAEMERVIDAGVARLRQSDRRLPSASTLGLFYIRFTFIYVADNARDNCHGAA